MNSVSHSISREFSAIALFLGLLITGLLAGCAQQPNKPSSMMDNPDHHYVAGMEALEQGDAKRALAKFDQALRLDKAFAPALAGNAWFNAISTVTSRGLMEPYLSGEFRTEDTVDGPELLLSIFKPRNVLNIH